MGCTGRASWRIRAPAAAPPGADERAASLGACRKRLGLMPVADGTAIRSRRGLMMVLWPDDCRIAGGIGGDHGGQLTRLSASPDYKVPTTFTVPPNRAAARKFGRAA
jgi:hypothetical protein